MMFRVGDMVKGNQESRTQYCITNDEAICQVVEILSETTMKVKVVEHPFAKIWEVFAVEMKYFDLLKEKEKEKTIVEGIIPYEFSEKTMKTIKRKMSDLLTEYNHPNSDEGLDAILAEYKANKGELAGILSKHPNWNPENLGIVFSSSFKRGMDKTVIENFVEWFKDEYVDAYCKENELKYAGKTYYEWKRILSGTWHTPVRNFAMEAIDSIDKAGYYVSHSKYLSSENYNRLMKVVDFFYKIIRYHPEEDENGRVYKAYDILDKLTEGKIDQEIADLFNKVFPDLRAANGQKFSRVINKLGKLTGIDQIKKIRYDGRDYGWNRKFAMFADAVNPLTITRHTIISVNPLDYLTASFGHNWASCHTIDSENKRDVDSGHNYHGMYMSGTLSYMLDSASIIFYTVDSVYNGKEFWTQDKMQRCMFHFQNDKLAQGRVYPDGRDGGDESFAGQFRAIVQKVLCDCLGIPNLWTKKTRNDMYTYTISNGTNYPDYREYSDCVMSFLKGTENSQCIQIGHHPICPCCGGIHNLKDSLCCEECKEHICNRCGAICDSSEMIRIGNESYCCEECAEEAGYVNTQDAGWQNRSNCCQDDYTGEWFYYWESSLITTEDGSHFLSAENAEAAGYHMAADTGRWHHENNLYECPVCGYYFAEDYDTEHDCCCECAREMEEENEE